VTFHIQKLAPAINAQRSAARALESSRQIRERERRSARPDERSQVEVVLVDHERRDRIPSLLPNAQRAVTRQSGWLASATVSTARCAGTNSELRVSL
jgi:hypothetical protein